MNATLKSSIFFILLGCLFISTILMCINYGARHSVTDQTGKVNRLMAHTMDPQIVSFGSSVGEVGFNSRIISKNLNKSVYNFSIDGTSFIQYKGLIDEYIENSPKNELIVFLESYFTFQNPKQVSNLERYIAHLNNKNLYEALYQQQPDLLWKCKYVPFYEFIPVTHVFYKNAIKGLVQYFLNNEFKDTLYGQTPVYRGWEIDQDIFLKTGKPFKIALDSMVIETYIEKLKEIKRKGKNLVIVLPPVYVGLTKNKLTDFSPLILTFQRISKITGFRFIDFTQDSISQDKSYFYNSNHLNYLGADLFSQMLSDSLKTQYFVK